MVVELTEMMLSLDEVADLANHRVLSPKSDACDLSDTISASIDFHTVNLLVSAACWAVIRSTFWLS